MSQIISFTQFCQRYQLDPNAESSTTEYQLYCEKMEVVNQAFAESITEQAISKANDQGNALP